MADLRDRVSDGKVSFQEIADAMKTATSEGGIYFGSMDKASQTTAGKISTLKDDFNSALGSMTESLLPFVTSAVEKFSQLAQWFSNLDDNGKKIVLTLARKAMAIGPVSLAIGKLIKIGSNIKKMITLVNSWNLITKAQAVATKSMTIAQGALNAVMNANPISLIIIAITALIAIIVLLWTKCEWFREGVMTIITTIWNAIQTVCNFIWGIISGVINSVINAFQTVASVVSRVFNALKSTIQNIFNGVVAMIKAPINGLIGLVNKVIKGFNKIKMPDWIPGIGGKGINIPLIPKLATGTNYIAREGLAYLHEGEAVVPKKYNPAVGGYGNSTPNIVVVADMDVNKFGKAFVRDIKTFSGGAKNSYNYGGAR